MPAFPSCWCGCCQLERYSFHDNSINVFVNTGVGSYLSFSPGLLKIRTYSSCGFPDSTVRNRYFIKIVSWPILFLLPTPTTSCWHLGPFLRMPTLILQWRTGHQSKIVAPMSWANEYPKIQPLICLKKKQTKTFPSKNETLDAGTLQYCARAVGFPICPV